MPSKLQKVCLQYGRDCWEQTNVCGLINFLRRNGKHEEAYVLARLAQEAKILARDNYFRERKKLQPDWKDWSEQIAEEISHDGN